jgi:hypothetical protein
MSDEAITDPQDSPATDPVVEGDVSAPAKEADSAEAVAEKRLHDTQAKLTEVAEENARLKEKQQEFQEQYLAEVHKVVTREPAQPQLSPDQEEARLEKLADDWGISKEAVLQIGNMKADAVEAAKAANESTLKEIKESQVLLQQSIEPYFILVTHDLHYQNNP